MKIRLLGMGEAELKNYGVVKNGEVIEVSDQDGANILRQAGMWESAEKKNPEQKQVVEQNKKMDIPDTK